MPKTHKQHYIPCFYLNNFANKLPGKVNKYKLRVFDFSVSKNYDSLVNNVAHFHNLHETPFVPNNYWEKVISDYEGSYSLNLRIFLQKCNDSSDLDLIITNNDKVFLSEAMRIQSLRTSRAITVYSDLIKRSIDEMIVSVLGYTAPITLSSHMFPFYLNKIGFSKNEYIKTFFDKKMTEEFFSLIRNRIWVVAHIDDLLGDYVFCVSDNPVVYYNAYTGEVRIGKATLNKRSSLLAYPLDKKNMLIVFADDGSFFDRATSDSVSDKIIFITDPEQVNFLNWLTRKNMFSQLYLDNSINYQNIINGIDSVSHY